MIKTLSSSVSHYLKKTAYLSPTLFFFLLLILVLFPIIERHSSIMIHFLINVTVSIDRNCKDVFFCL